MEIKLLIEFHEMKHWPERLHSADRIPPIPTIPDVPPTGGGTSPALLEDVLKYFRSRETKITPPPPHPPPPTPPARPN